MRREVTIKLTYFTKRELAFEACGDTIRFLTWCLPFVGTCSRSDFTYAILQDEITDAANVLRTDHDTKEMSTVFSGGVPDDVAVDVCVALCLAQGRDFPKSNVTHQILHTSEHRRAEMQKEVDRRLQEKR